ncbi:hypothetical protein BDY24DRAFT_414825 [Mrakia frigida]|uniref:dTDP-4-dehydrorhamnose reductase family protein n=1 Tax=Mrakia frigida TaxID=29902 RepID=UPI003FCC1020
MKGIITGKSTGASGLLGRAVLEVFSNEKDMEVLGLAFTRASDSSKLKKLDLLDQDAVEAFFELERPQFVIHCAAERRPDASAQDPEKARKINAEVPRHLARLAKKLNFRLVYISTDYVFPGTAPPYATTSEPEPLQFYGVTKREGELAVLEEKEGGGMGVVLRVPLLYGPTEYNTEGPVNFLLDVVMDRSSGKTYQMDTYQTRYPTNVHDVARTLLQIVRLFPPPSPPSSMPTSTQKGLILHFSSRRAFTKMDMCRVMAGALRSGKRGKTDEELGLGHLVEDGSVPAEGVIRPKDTQLSLSSLEENGIVWNEEKSFEEWWSEYLGPGGRGRPPQLD